MPIITNNLIQLESLFHHKRFNIRIVGGAVRDCIIGKEINDIDLATDASPEEQLAIYTENNIKHIPTGIEHGTITVLMGDEEYQITSLRSDIETDGRHAKVRFTKDWTKDLSRRDFTINAMSMTFSGNIYDPFGGQYDLENGIVRFVGNAEERIKEDYLRILRWFRFTAGYSKNDFGFTHNIIQYSAVIQANSAGLANISKERIWSEIKKLVFEPNGINAMKVMINTGVADVIHMPTDNLDMELIMVAKKHSVSPEIVISAMLQYEIEKINATADSWNWSNNERKYSNWISNNINKDVDLLESLIVDGSPKDWLINLAKLENRDYSVLEKDIPKFPFTGFDLLKYQHIKPNQRGDILRTLKRIWVKNQFKLTKEDLISLCSPKI